ncbi:hypothetical protein WICPIJ_008434 [Wickerhamomyces pijperi]|uniref:Mo25-like protein n=1 Tax=Wickerhamomyces pijperi TaxID=599730 RepID=A0A9P8PX88_WICPI|nr:hypothetical protein WICPIJ_008434 [Wickerhamomyces pijperi]
MASFFFKRNPKTPSELVRTLNEQVTKFDTSSDRKKLQDETARYLNSIKVILNGDEDNDPQPDNIAQLAQEVYQTDLLFNLIVNLSNLEFDSRKDVSSLFSTLLRRQIGNRSPTVDYLVANPKVLRLLMRGPEIPNIALITGAILRDCIRVESLAAILLDDPTFWKYFDFSKKGTFENITDAFQTLSDLMLTHKQLTARWLRKNSVNFVRHINSLISSNSYVTKRQSIKFLSQILLDRLFREFMLLYVDSPENLKLVMILLSDKSKNLQVDSFNVFKIFIANPGKSKPVLDILAKNKDKLLQFLENFNPADRKDDKVFREEMEFVIQRVNELPRIKVNNGNVSPNNNPNHYGLQGQSYLNNNSATTNSSNNDMT